jgi:hypothetical protein
MEVGQGPNWGCSAKGKKMFLLCNLSIILNSGMNWPILESNQDAEFDNLFSNKSSCLNA